MNLINSRESILNELLFKTGRKFRIDDLEKFKEELVMRLNQRVDFCLKQDSVKGLNSFINSLMYDKNRYSLSQLIEYGFSIHAGDLKEDYIIHMYDQRLFETIYEVDWLPTKKNLIDGFYINYFKKIQNISVTPKESLRLRDSIDKLATMLKSSLFKDFYQNDRVLNSSSTIFKKGYAANLNGFKLSEPDRVKIINSIALMLDEIFKDEEDFSYLKELLTKEL